MTGRVRGTHWSVLIVCTITVYRRVVTIVRRSGAGVHESDPAPRNGRMDIQGTSETHEVGVWSIVMDVQNSGVDVGVTGVRGVNIRGTCCKFGLKTRS